jgi:crotonobetainyl-CoA:carnitine CoA-transferase CaiB-like acyl-CoA transferase
VTEKTGPLAGTRALDLVDGLGAYGPRLFRGLGAEVIRVEPPGGSSQRRISPLVDQSEAGGDDLSLYFLHYNAGKKSITLDIETAPGRDLLRRLLGSAEVVFDNGQLAKAGFDLDELAAKSPPLVIVSITPFGFDSPRASWLGDDLVCQAMSGMISYFGYKGERPARFGPQQASEMSGLAACLGALIALFDARRSGKGDVIDIAAERVGALVTLQMSNASMYQQFGFIRRRHERGSGELTLYKASDGYVQMGAFRSLTPLLNVLEKEGAAEDLREVAASLPPEEFARNPRVREVIQSFASSRTRWELAAAVQAENVMCVPINDVADLVRDPFLQKRGYFGEVGFDGAEALFEDAGVPIRFAETPYNAGGSAPRAGEHNSGVYTDLGLTEADIARLSAESII